MQKKSQLIEILVANVRYLKINNIEADLGLTKTALQRMIARAEIPEKYRAKIETWWIKWVNSITYHQTENYIPLSKVVEYAKNTPLNKSFITDEIGKTEENQQESYDGLLPKHIWPIGGGEVIKDYLYYEKLGKNVKFDNAEDLIIEIMAAPLLKGWQKPMLQKMINARFF